MNTSRVLLLLAVVCFALAAFGVPMLGPVALVALGLAFAFGAQLVP